MVFNLSDYSILNSGHSNVQSCQSSSFSILIEWESANVPVRSSIRLIMEPGSGVMLHKYVTDAVYIISYPTIPCQLPVPLLAVTETKP